jgi:hypothetical protein
VHARAADAWRVEEGPALGFGRRCTGMVASAPALRELQPGNALDDDGNAL